MVANSEVITVIEYMSLVVYGEPTVRETFYNDDINTETLYNLNLSWADPAKKISWATIIANLTPALIWKDYVTIPLSPKEEKDRLAAVENVTQNINEIGQDATFNAFQDTATVDVTYDDVNNTFKADIISDSSNQRVNILKAGVSVATRKAINFIEGLGITLTVADDNANNRVNVTAARSNKTFIYPTFANVTSAQRLSPTRDAHVQYTFDGSLALTLLAGQSITSVLKYADDAAFTTNVVTVDSQKISASGILSLNQTNSIKVTGGIPAGKYRKVELSSTGSAPLPTSFLATQEVLD